MNKHRMWYIAAFLFVCVSAFVGCHHGGYGGGYGSCPPQGGFAPQGGVGGSGYMAPGGTFAPPGGGAAPYQAPRGSGLF